MNRHNSSIGFTTLRGVRRLLEKDKDKDKEGEKEREREKEKDRGMQLHKMVSEQRIEDVQLLLADPVISRYLSLSSLFFFYVIVVINRTIGR